MTTSDRGLAEPTPTAGSRPATLLARAGPGVTIAATFTFAAVASWGNFGELIVDTGRELDVPRRLLEGERLYCDVRWYYGPLAPWLNAGLYRIFGVHLNVLAMAGLATAGAMAATLYFLTRRFASRIPATTVAVAFIFLCAFANVSGYAIANFVLPYTFAATYGMLAAALSLLFLVRHAQAGNLRDFLWSCGFLALAALSKIEPLAPALAAHATFALSSVVSRRRVSWPHVGACLATAAVPILAYGGVAAQCGQVLWSDNLRALANPGSAGFISWSMGMDRPWVSAGWAAASVGMLAATFALAVGAGFAASRVRRPTAAVLVAVPLVAAFAVYYADSTELAFRGIPPLAAATFFVAAWRWLRDPSSRRETLPLLILCAFTVLALGRIILRPTLEVYGFFLLPVPLVCLAVLFAEHFPQRFAAKASVRHAVTAALVGVLLGAASAIHVGSAEIGADRTIEVASARGTLRLPRSQEAVAKMIELLRAYPAQTRILSLPEGAGVHFFSGLSPADLMSSHLPMELPDAARDRALLQRLQQSPPELVLSITREMTEFGYQGFGIDYGKETAAWILAEYEPIKATHPGVVLLSRRKP